MCQYLEDQHLVIFNYLPNSIIHWGRRDYIMINRGISSPLPLPLIHLRHVTCTTFILHTLSREKTQIACRIRLSLRAFVMTILDQDTTSIQRFTAMFNDNGTTQLYHKCMLCRHPMCICNMRWHPVNKHVSVTVSLICLIESVTVVPGFNAQCFFS